jgi:hypothetical protein
MPIIRTSKLYILTGLFTVGIFLPFANAQESQEKDPVKDQSERKTTEPVYRVSKSPDIEKSKSAPPATTTDPNAKVEAHPLDAALQMAYGAQERISENIFDYTATMLKRERLDGKLGEYEQIHVKIRNGRTTENGTVPFAIYMKFINPSAGREVIWVDGQNKNKLVAHEGGRLNFVSVQLVPDGAMAMRGNRYPVYEAGIENLVAKLIEKGERDRAAGPCEVTFYKDTKVAQRPCTMLQVVHAEKKHPYDFHVARVFIDDELQLPIRYAAYSWPATPGGQPILEEEYTYTDIKVNVGLTDADFNPHNAQYNYPKRGLR